MVRYLLGLGFTILSTGTFAQSSKGIHSILFTGTYTSLPWYNISGGLRQGFVYMDNADVSLTYQYGRMSSWEDNLVIYVYGVGNHGGEVTSLTGDYQVASNIQAPASWKLFEGWVQKNFLKGRLSVLLGQYDLNSEFDIINPATYFINSSFGIGAEYAQSGVNGPSIFPYTSATVRITGKPADNLLVKFALLDGVSGDPARPLRNPIRIRKNDGYLLASEFTLFTQMNKSGASVAT